MSPDNATFRGEGAYRSHAGVLPLAEHTQIEMKPCSRCGRKPTESKTGLATNMISVDDVIYANTICFDCLTDEERALYEEISGG